MSTENMIKRFEIACTLQAVTELFTQKEVSIQGGFARDLHYGRLPKDADIFIHLGNDGKGLFKPEELNLFVTKFVGNSFGPIMSEFMVAYGESDKDDFAERHYGVLKLYFTDHSFSVDLIFTKPSSTKESLESFDCNLNQFFINKEGLPEHLKKEPTELVFSTKPIRSCRITKMIDLAKSIGVTVNE